MTLPWPAEPAPPREELERQIALLEPLVTEARRQRMQAVLETRSDHVAFVFERMIDPHNFSAALRSLDAMSFQDAWLVQPGERLDFSRGITIGAERWLTLHGPPTTEACLRELKNAGYRVLASRLEDPDSAELRRIDFSVKTALVFGNEHLGVSEEVLEHADGRFHIAMLGFSQSFNLSVAVALSAFHARNRIDELAGSAPGPEPFRLDGGRRRALYARWLRQSVKHAERILAGDPPEGGEP